MFIRIKQNPKSAKKNVQIVQSMRKGNSIVQKIVRHVGAALDEKELEQLKLLAQSIKEKMEAENKGLLFSPEELAKVTITKDKLAQSQEYAEADYIVNVKNLKEEDRIVSGIHDVYGKLFDELGYDNVLRNPARNVNSAQILKDIVMARIANPVSKMASVSMLEENFGVSIKLDQVYQMMDKLDDVAIERLKNISYHNTSALFGQKIDLVFFDCTTLYFESFTEDEFKENGYSKDLKFNQPQVLLALMVTKEGLPIGYEVFPGSTYEGHTLVPMIKNFRQRYHIDKVLFVADAGMMNKENIALLEAEDIEYIVGCRLKNLNKEMQDQITEHANYTQIAENVKIAKFAYNGQQIIVSYSAQRARKDAADRNKAIERLRKKLTTMKNPKEYLSNYGYKKYLKIEGTTKFILDEEKIQAAQIWDGLHGVITNNHSLTSQEILAQYNNLWQVEEAFRVTKHDLKVRPIYHWSPARVRAHLAISYLAFSLVKYLEYRVKVQYQKMSPEKIRQTLLNVQTSIMFDATKNIRYAFPSKISSEAKKIYQICTISRYLTPYILKKL